MGAGIPLQESAWRTGAPADDTLVAAARAAVTADGVAGGWEAAFDGAWCTVRPPGEAAAPGRRIHVGAAGTVAVEVLAAVAAVLAADPCPFRFAADREHLRQLAADRTGPAGGPGPVGTFITVHPREEAQFQRLLARLHRAVDGLPGSVVLGDDGAGRPVPPGPAGERTPDERTPDERTPGLRVADERAADERGPGHRCPPWMVDPVEGRGSTRRARGAGAVLVGGRYALAEVVRRSAEGGVFLGTDATDGTPVVVKQARARTDGDRSGTDPRTALRQEARLLGELAELGLTARPLELLTQGDSVLLVREHLPGQPLDSWVAARSDRGGGPAVPWAQARPMALALLDLLDRVHRAGLVLRDLSPADVVVLPDGSLRLVGVELACAAGAVAGAAGTPGYRAPEQSGRLLAADPAVDLFALGGLFFLLATGHDPLLPEDLPRARPLTERLDRWLALAAREGETAARLAPLVLGLRAAEPGGRWPLSRIRAALGAPPDRPRPSARVQPQPLDRVLLDGLRHLVATATPQRPDRLWPAAPDGQHTDPCDVGHGAAGVLAVLARCLPQFPDGAATVRQAASWIERRCAAEPVVLPGLHRGRSGTVWALLDAAEAVGDPALAARARRLAEAVPRRWPHPGVCRGAAGAGFMRLRLG
ncbi:hypothetical protein ACFW1A_36575, partial [Kitasatospora sp. NPDC058965]